MADEMISDHEELMFPNEESRKRPHSSSTMPDDILHENDRVKVPKNSAGEEDDLKREELDYDSDKNSINYLLDDDCLFHIFSFLPFCDLIKIERVCKRWQKISLESWRKVKFVNIYKDFNIPILQLNHLEQILSRCGNYITGLEFKCNQDIVKAHNIFASCQARGMEGLTACLCELRQFLAIKGYTLDSKKETQLHADDAVKLINNYCKRLNYLNFFHAFINTETSYLKFLDVNILKNLKSLAVESYNDQDNQVPNVLKKCANLTEFNVSGYVFTRNELLNLAEIASCTSLAVIYSRTFSDGMLREVFEKYRNLENLDISGTAVVPSTILPFTERLKCLSLWSMENFFKVDIGNFNVFYCPNLRVLDISCNAFTLSGDILSVLIRKCPNIEDLRLKMCKSLIVPDFIVLKELKNLLYLDVSFTAILSETLIDLSKTLGKLKKLECYGCRNVDSKGISNVIAASPELTYLSISKSLLTKEMIESALVSVRERNNKVDLTICVGGRNDKVIAEICGLIEELELKSISYECSGKNVIRIVYGSSVCDCNFYKTCFCLNGLNTIAYLCLG